MGRTKEVDEAINIVSNVRTSLMNFNELVNEHKDIIDSVEKVLSYISDLEKENMGLLTRLKADSLIDRDNYWRKKIIDKIEILEEQDELYKEYKGLEFSRTGVINLQIRTLKELLGE